MKKSLVGILAAAGFVAAASFGMQGCSGSSGADGGGGGDVIQACSADSDCASYGGSLGGLCNTTAHVCMQKCASISDCPATENTCTAYTPPGGTAVSGTVCSAGTGCVSPAVINTLDGHCETACSSSAGCTGYSTASPRECTGGLCLPAVADAGACAGVTCPIAGQTPDPTMACACTGGNTCTTTSDCQTGANIGDACIGSSCSVDLCEAPTYPYTAGSGPIVWGTSAGVAVTPDPDPNGSCDAAGGTVLQYTTNVFFPAGDDIGSSAYMSVFSVKSSGALAGNTYLSVVFGADSFTWENCAATQGTPAAIEVTDENGVNSNDDCVPQ